MNEAFAFVLRVSFSRKWNGGFLTQQIQTLAAGFFLLLLVQAPSAWVQTPLTVYAGLVSITPTNAPVLAAVEWRIFQKIRNRCQATRDVRFIHSHRGHVIGGDEFHYHCWFRDHQRTFGRS